MSHTNESSVDDYILANQYTWLWVMNKIGMNKLNLISKRDYWLELGMTDHESLAFETGLRNSMSVCINYY